MYTSSSEINEIPKSLMPYSFFLSFKVVKSFGNSEESTNLYFSSVPELDARHIVSQ